LSPVPDDVLRAYSITDGSDGARPEGFIVGRSLMSYVHLHWGSNPGLADNFVAACAGRC
jgi:cobyrinic acid a,c-diamide synthase